MSWGSDTEWEDEMKSGDWFIDVLCTVLVSGMGLLALWFEYGGKNKEPGKEAAGKASPEERSDNG